MVVGYGKKIRAQVHATKKSSRKKYECPECSRNAVEFVSAGVWKCKNCKTKFASDSYEFKKK